MTKGRFDTRFIYVLSKENTPRVKKHLQDQLAAIELCEAWRVKHRIKVLPYDITIGHQCI